MRRPSSFVLLAAAALVAGLAAVPARSTSPALPPSAAPPARAPEAAPAAASAASAHGAASAAAAPGALASDEAPMVRVPGGTFSMGSTAAKAEPNESPVRSVTVGPFWIDRSEVTVGAYLRCVERGRCAPPRAASRACVHGRGDPRLPMNCVGFDEADHYCLAHGKRLPTEAEWEFAARGSDGRVFPWGNDPPACERAVSTKGEASAEGCGDEPGPLPVGGRSRGQSAFKLDDMAGNVEEWVADFYDDRHTAETSDPRGAAPSFARVLRGGSWASPRRMLRATARSWGSSEEHGPTVGFRCAR